MSLPQWVIGVFICIGGNTLANLGWVIQKYSHMQNQAKPTAEQKEYYKQKVWIIGCMVYIVGNLGDIVALGFAAQSLVAPLGSVVLVVNAIVSPCILKEKITLRDLQAILVIIVGDVLIVLYANHEETSYSLSQLIDFFLRPVFIAFFLVTAVILAFLSHEKDFLERKLDVNDPSFYDEEKKGDRNKWIKDDVFHPYCYAALAGVVGGISVLLAKCVAELVKVTMNGDSTQFKNPVSWLFCFLLIATCLAQCHWINQGLERYDSFYIVPMFHVHWNVWSILGGIIFFQEFKTFTAINYGLFLLGVTCILVGVAFLSQREMNNQLNDYDENVNSTERERLVKKTAETVS